MSESRHNPDQLLKEIQADEEKRNKGHLKIFFGYAAGCLLYTSPSPRD